jgi:hypothetical protein
MRHPRRVLAAVVAAAFVAGTVAAPSDAPAAPEVRHYTVQTGDTSWGAIVRKHCAGRTSSAAQSAFSVAATGSTNGVVRVGQVIHVDPANCPAAVATTTTSPTTTAAAASTTSSSTSTTTTVAPTSTASTTTPTAPPPGSVAHGRDLTKAMVGPRVPAVQVFTTRQTITVPGVYTAIDYRAGVDVRAAGVVFVDCRFSSTNVNHSAVVHTNRADTVLVHSEIDGRSLVYVGIKAEVGADRLVVERSYMHHVGHGLNTSAVSWRMTESWIDNIVAPNPAPIPSEDVWHADGVISWGSNTLAERNVIDLGALGQTAAVNHGTWSGSGPVSNVTYRDNVLAGGGYTVYFEERSFPLKGLVVTGNDMRPGPYGYVYPGARPAQMPVWSNNRRPDGTLIAW